MGVDRLIEGMVSRMLVAAQFGMIAVLLLPFGLSGNAVIGSGLAAVGLAWLGWTVACNPPGNFHIRPESRPGARLITAGPYRWVRHPMYLGVLVAGGGAVVAGPAVWRDLAWLALAGVLIAKARLEEAALRRQFAEYGAYCQGRRFLVPGLW